MRCEPAENGCASPDKEEMRSYMKKILIHGSGHKASSWEKTVAHMDNSGDILCPELCSLLNGKTASYANLYDSFARYCNAIDGQVHLCGISLGGILALNYALDFPEKTKTLVLIGTPYKIPKLAFAFQNMIFRFLPESVFENMAFNKKDTFLLGDSMKILDFSGRLQNIKCPALIICGEKDTANRKAAHFLSENMKNAELKIIENTGHFVNEEAPGILAEILNEYYGLHRE